MNRINSVLAITGGLAAGAGLMYLLDPDRGGRRRARARRQIGRVAELATTGALETAQELGSQARAAITGKRRNLLRMPKSRAGRLAVGSLAAALAGGTFAAARRSAID